MTGQSTGELNRGVPLSNHPILCPGLALPIQFSVWGNRTALWLIKLNISTLM